MNYIPAELWLPLTHQERDVWVSQLHRDQLRAAAERRSIATQRGARPGRIRQRAIVWARSFSPKRGPVPQCCPA
ncbi:hypothetical protein [Arthrobacter sp. HS15c]|uniref:hypothetical protein n=1 Tax=Arthrobacter sp. HS15c TaxID=3230279 RepID=UPI0034651F21